MTMLRQREVMKLYNVSKQALRRWVKQGILSEIRTPGGHRRYIKEELEKILFRNIVSQRVAGQN
jgi:excisionase family DNA binding protein